MEKGKWINVDTDAMPKDIKTAYNTYKVASDKATELRKTFESAFIKACKVKPDAGCALKLSFKFGKLSLAMLDAKAVSKSKGDDLDLF